MSRRRRRRRGGERERTRYPHHGTPLVEGSLIPQGQRPCVCGSGNRSNGSEFPDSSITNIFHSSLPSFASLPPPLGLSLRARFPLAPLPPSFPPTSPFILLSIFSCVARAPRASVFFFSIGNYQWMTPCWLRSVERTPRRRYLSSVNPVVGSIHGYSRISVQTYS